VQGSLSCRTLLYEVATPLRPVDRLKNQDTSTIMLAAQALTIHNYCCSGYFMEHDCAQGAAVGLT